MKALSARQMFQFAHFKRMYGSHNQNHVCVNLITISQMNNTESNHAASCQASLRVAVVNRSTKKLNGAYTMDEILQLIDRDGLQSWLPRTAALERFSGHRDNGHSDVLLLEVDGLDPAGDGESAAYALSSSCTKRGLHIVGYRDGSHGRTWIHVGCDQPHGITADAPYIGLLWELSNLARAERPLRDNRTEIKTVSVFGRQVRFPLAAWSLPLLTTKRVPFVQMLEELLWFCRGETDANVLSEKKIKIWDGNSSRSFLDQVGLGHYATGDIGPGYGFQWRHAGAEYRGPKPRVSYSDTEGVDQLAYVERLLKTDPMSRRIVLSAWNPADLGKMALPPCHVMAQWYVRQDCHGAKHLSCMLTMRSCDTFLGLPWNIASYATLTHILAKRCGMEPEELVVSIGDCHLYANCIEQAAEQLQRSPTMYPMLRISERVASCKWEEILASDFCLVGYYPHAAIKADMAV